MPAARRRLRGVARHRQRLDLGLETLDLDFAVGDSLSNDTHVGGE